MIQKIKKPVSILLSLFMVFSLFTIVPITASAYDGNPYSSLVNTTTSVKFNDIDWYIIADNSTAADAGTVMLLTKEPIAAMAYLDRGPTAAWNNNQPEYYHYSTSTVKAYLDGLTDEGGSFADVADAIASTDLTDDGVVSGVKLFLPRSELSGVPSNVLKCTNINGVDVQNRWWRRGKGNWNTTAAAVSSDEGVASKDVCVGLKIAVRPVLNLDLSKVTFDSATNTFALNASPIASVTSGDTTTEYSELSTALTNWVDGSTLTLLADVTTNSTITVSGTKTLDLNGCELKMTGNGRVIAVSDGASLTLNDVEGNIGKITGGKSDRGAGVRNDGNFTMNGGTITNNFATAHGGGVYTNGDFIMNGGIITNNTANDFGGGVSASSGNFTMNGGKIINNTSSGGGGVYISTSFVMNDGEISGNNTPNYTYGGGVYVGSSGSLSFSGSVVIKNNTAGNDTSNVYLTNNKIINIIGELTCDDGSIGITMQTPGVFSNTSDTSLNDPTKFTSDDVSYAVVKNASNQLELVNAYTVTWNNWNGDNLEIDTGVVVGATPSYDGETPTKTEDDTYTYTFSGWNPEITAVTGDVTYTATFSTALRLEETVDEKSPTCVEDGNIAYFVGHNGKYYTLVDGEYTEISAQDVVLPATGIHTAGEPVKENEVAPTYESEGSYEEVVYCSVCGEELSRQTVVVPVRKLIDVTELSLNNGQIYSAVLDIPEGDTYKIKSKDISVASVNSAGRIVARGEGTTEIEITTSSGMHVVCTVEVTDVNNITLDKSELVMNVKDSYTFTATYPDTETCAWKSSNPNVVTVNQNGKIVARGEGTATIYARAEKSGTATCEITVNKAPEEIILDKTELSLNSSTKDIYTLKATLLPEDAQTTLIFKSSNPSVASVNSAGRIVARGEGTATIKVISTNGKVATCTVQVS